MGGGEVRERRGEEGKKEWEEGEEGRKDLRKVGGNMVWMS